MASKTTGKTMIFWRKKKDEIPTNDAAPSQAEVTASPAAAELQPQIQAQPEPVAEPVVAEEQSSGNWMSRLVGGLGKSTSKITQGLSDLVTKRKLDQDMIDQLEEVLITADLGPKTASRIVTEFAEGRFGKDMDGDEIRAALADVIARILDPVNKPIDFTRRDTGPFTVLVCGVNGVGKTTTIGKMAYNLHKREGKRVMLAAGDTFRAAATEQLKIWAERAGGGIVARDIGADSAAVAYEAYAAAKAEGADVLFIDTAGRLHNKKNLMDELQKIIRVLRKHDENLPHAVILVLDATTGQNAHAQVETFRDMVDVSALVVTKLDGSAKGGVVVGLADRFGLPIIAVGVGEQAEDLQPFHPDAYARSLVGVGI
ncbi:signal recognition particle-docking protein FtsY [Micavibrio aeruginosavorus ARL-13]|uniref:Signal recognition particle receptor FtsY n=2 Tax=Micavibrio aeruginosavorus TaxID=349221 RepID=G2KNH2_MICAA|nr:signal recognition particle-docking protein FtsY [Micavibrio aeruginosavorus ARL-13]